MIIFGYSNYGALRLPGCKVATKFGQLMFVPLLPYQGVLMTPDGKEFELTGISWLSCLVAWVRTAAVFAFLGFFLAFMQSLERGKFPLDLALVAAGGIALAAISFTSFWIPQFVRRRILARLGGGVAYAINPREALGIASTR